MSSTSRLRTTASTAGLILLLGAALFGLASLTAPVSMMLGQIPLSAQLMALATSMDYVMGDAATMAQVTHNYTQAFGAIAPHMALGGLAMFLCSLQFIPVLRRRWPRLHRTIGKAAMWAIVTAMVGAIGYLAMTPAGEVFSGEAFAAALWVQAVSTLACLWLAIQAIRAKQYQAHMGWMALLFAILLTAPLMRLEQTVLGALTPWTLSQVTAGLSALLLPQTIWPMALWMHTAGRKDMPLLRPTPMFAPTPLRVLAWMAAATALHEACLVPFGLDLLAHWRPASSRLPAIAALWGLASTLMLPGLPRTLHDVMQGRPPGRAQLGLGLAASLGALLIAIHLPLRDNHGFTASFYWAGAGMLGLGVSAAGLLDRRHGATHAALRALAATSWLVPAAWAPMAWALSWTGWSGPAVMASTYVLSAGFFAWHGFASAFGLPMSGFSRPAPRPEAARA
jgi:hypothetical protein